MRPADFGIAIKLQGDRDLQAALEQLRRDVVGDPMRRAVREAADHMRRVIVDFAPHKTGRLINNIGLSTRTTPYGPVGIVTVSTKGGKDNPANSFYWKFLEFGWHDPAHVPHQMQFVKPAYDAEAVDAAQTVIDSLEASVNRASQRASVREAGSFMDKFYA